MNHDDAWVTPDWQQRGLNALRATLDVDSATKRDMIEFLFATGLWDREKLSWQAAVTRFNACLNPDKGDFFKLAEVWVLMKRFHRFDLLYAMAEDLGFAPLQERPTEARRQQLLERLAEAHERHAVALEELSGELARLGMPEDALRMHAAMGDPGAKFDVDDGDLSEPAARLMRMLRALR